MQQTHHQVYESLCNLGVDMSQLPDDYLKRPPRLITCEDWCALLPCIHAEIACNMQHAGATVQGSPDSTNYSRKLETLQKLAEWIQKCCTPRGIMHVRVIRKRRPKCLIPHWWHTIL